MSLADHWDETGGDYLGAGDHEVFVSGAKMGRFPNANNYPFVEFDVKSATTMQINTVTITLTAKSLWKLISFVKACGVSKDDCRNYEPNDLQCHQGMLNMRLMVRVAPEKNKEGKVYNNVVDFWALNAEVPGAVAPPPVAPPVAEAPIKEDDIPF